MADVLYYVSQQNGNDSNDGTSAALAWKTLTKAMQSVPTPSAGDNIYVYIGSGTYRERVIPTNNGLSTTEKIYYCGDPNSVYLTSDTPGKIRITGCGSDEYPTNGSILNWTGKTYVELWDADVDGSLNDYACYNVTARRVNAASINGFYSGTQYNCTAIGGNYGFSSGTSYNCTAIGNYGFYSGTSYNCTAIGGSYGFSSGTSYNCTAIGGNYGFYSGTSYNCTAIGGNYGFRDGTSYNCTAIGGNYGFNSGTQYNCTAIGGNYGFSGGTSYNCKTLYVKSSPKILSKHIGVDMTAITPSYNYLFGMDKYGYIHNVNISASSSMNLQAERLYAFTPPEVGKSIGVQLRINSLAASGNITVELQKYISSTWTTQKSKTISIANLTTSGEGYNYFEWDTSADAGDNSLTAVASTWRYRITADANASSTVLYGSNSTTPTVMGSFIPDKITEDIEGKKIYTSVLGGSLDQPSIALDSSTYNTNAPSIKFTGAGEKILKLPVKKNVSVTVSYYVRHSGAISGSEPQIRLQHKDITTQTSTHSAGLNTWEQLSVSVTPTFDGVLDVILSSRDPLVNAWFSDPAVA